MVIENIKEIWSSISGAVPEQYSFLVYLAVYAIVIAIYAIFVWKFYRFLGKRDVIELHLWKYIKTEQNVIRKFIASVFFLIEYIIVMPFLVFFWYAVLCLFILVLAKGQAIADVLLIGMAIVAAVRITSYFNQNLSKELAKMLPFTLLAVFLVTPGFFNVENMIDRFAEIPKFLEQMIYYIIFVVLLEMVMRLFAVIKQFFVRPKEDVPVEADVPVASKKKK